MFNIVFYLKMQRRDFKTTSAKQDAQLVNNRLIQLNYLTANETESQGYWLLIGSTRTHVLQDIRLLQTQQLLEG